MAVSLSEYNHYEVTQYGLPLKRRIPVSFCITVPTAAHVHFVVNE